MVQPHEKAEPVPDGLLGHLPNGRRAGRRSRHGSGARGSPPGQDDDGRDGRAEQSGHQRDQAR